MAETHTITSFWLLFAVLTSFCAGLAYIMFSYMKSQEKVKTGNPRKINVIGLGGIGATFAFELSRAGHMVTVVARGERLEKLQKTNAIINTKGERADVTVQGELDTSIDYDLILVTVPALKVDDKMLSQLSQSKAKTIMFMFNTFDKLDRLRDAVGSNRFAFGFPLIMARYDNEILRSRIVNSGIVTTVTDQHWADIFTSAGIKSTTTNDMESWLRTHAVFVVPAMMSAILSYNRNKAGQQAGVTYQEATEFALATKEGFELVEELGNQIIPFPMPLIRQLPVFFIAAFLWLTSRIPSVRAEGATGWEEPRALIAAIERASPHKLHAWNNIKQFTQNE
jgi:2-dehydropantoate 2-reductase